jgi:type III restriction enzyme
MPDAHGQFLIGSLNNWEITVVTTEMKRPGSLAWYRNPGRASADSLAIAYRDSKNNWRRLWPDFIFFSVQVSIVDPHGFHFGDALPRIRGLAAFSVEFGDEFHRIEAVGAMKDKTLRVLDLKKESVRKAVTEADDAEILRLIHATR